MEEHLLCCGPGSTGWPACRLAGAAWPRPAARPPLVHTVMMRACLPHRLTLGLPPMHPPAEGGSVATRQLLGDYATPSRFATPMRTPARTPAAGGNRVMQEAQNLRRLQAGQTPLLGGENPELHPSDFSGVTPRAAPTQTPNPLAAAAAAVGATPGATPGRAVAGVAATPALGGLAGATPGRAVAGVAATPLLGATPGRGSAGGAPSATPTPMRDALGLNDPDSFTGGASRREEAARLALQRNELRAGLSQLPAPRNEYQIVVPELPGGQGPSCAAAPVHRSLAGPCYGPGRGATSLPAPWRAAGRPAPLVCAWCPSHPEPCARPFKAAVHCSCSLLGPAPHLALCLPRWRTCRGGGPGRGV